MFRFLVIPVVVCVANAVEFHFTNKENDDIWVGIRGNIGNKQLKKGGFILGAGRSVSIQAPENWAGQLWARTYCDPQTKNCSTGDCGSRLQCNGIGPVWPVSLAEISLKGFLGLDFYDISLVNGFNLPISLEPIDGQDNGSKNSCKQAACLANLNDQCPEELKVYSQLKVVGCQSACTAFNTDQYCCRNVYNQPQTCQTSDWPVNYSKFFKDRCPSAYSYAFDDRTSTFTCQAQKYNVTFGL